MKRRISFFILLILLGSAINAQQMTQQFSFSQSEVQTTQNGEYDVVRLTGDDYLLGEEYAGKPQMPIKQFKLLLPQGASATDVSLTMNSEQQLPGSFYLYPVQLPVYPNFEDPPPFVEPDPAIYNSNDPFPSDYIFEYETNGFRDYNYVLVRFTPFRYIPLSRDLFLLTSVTITVDYTVHPIGEVHKLRPYDNTDEMAYEFVKDLVVNPDQTDVFYADAAGKINQYRANRGIAESYGGFEPTELPALQGSPVDYVIITNNTDVYGNNIVSFTEKFQQLADWKTLSGSPAKVISVDAIRQAYPGVDIAEQIREFIKDAHRLWGTEYVLLGGNAPIVPVRWIGWDIDHPKVMPTDLYYSAIWHHAIFYDDNWNGNGNAVFGEWGSDENCDFTPDIAVGRAPVDTDDEVDLFLQKNFTYYRCSFASSIPDGDWLYKQLNIGGIIDARAPVNWGNALLGLYRTWQITEQFSFTEWKQYTMHEYLEGWETSHPDWCPAYYRPDPPYGCSNSGIPINDEYVEHAAVVNQLNQRYGIVNHIDHSGLFGLGLCGVTSTTNGLTSSDFWDLLPTNKYSVFLSAGCHVCPIDLNFYIGEQWLSAPNGGVVFIGASHDILTQYGNKYDYQFFNCLYNYNYHNIGITNNNTSITCNNTELKKMMQLLGDPELSIYTDVPVTMNVTHDNTIFAGTSDFDVSVSGLPVGELAKISLYKENEIQAFNSTAGEITFNITPDTPGEMKLTVTCHNTEPYETTINVMQNPGVHLYISNITIIDENANGFIEPGETVDLSIELRNSGATNASGINGLLIPGDVNTVVSQNTSGYPNINSGGIGSSNANYTFIAPTEGISYGKAISFELHITTSAQGNFNEPFFFNIKTSQLEIGDRTVNGGDPYQFVSGYVGHLYVDIYNYGAVTASNLTAVLTTELPEYVEIQTGTSVYGDIESFKKGTNSPEFKFLIREHYSGQALIFELTLTDGFGKTDVFEFNLREEPPGSISGFDFSPGKNDITLYWIGVNGTKGYNIYRSETETGIYERINNFLVTGTSMYYDSELEASTEYYYKISAVSITGNELNIGNLIANHAWTSLDSHGQFPIAVSDGVANSNWTSITVADVDENGTNELFPAFTRNRDGLIMGFNETGQELYDIDGDEATVSGFAEIVLPQNSSGKTEGGELHSEAAVGDVDNDYHAEVFVTTNGNYYADVRGYLFGFKTVDEEEPLNQPDPLWNGIPIDLGYRSSSSPVLANLDGDEDGFMDIITNQELQKIRVFSHDGSLKWEEQAGTGHSSSGYLAVADLDNKGYQEIINGSHTPGEIYIYNHDGSDYNINPVLINSVLPFNSNPVIANIDSDVELEIIIVGISNGYGKLYAINTDGSFVEGKWDGQINLNCSTGIAPQAAIGNLNNDGPLEIAIADEEKLYVFDNLGNNITGFPVEIADLKCGNRSPLLADVDSDDDIEIIVTASNDRIYAFNPDGTECIYWRLASKSTNGFYATPTISDINNDGLSEIIASDVFGKTFVWKTTGDAHKIEWGQYRHDSYNSGTYSNFCYYDAENPEIITSNEEWTENYDMRRDIIIKSSGTLTIHSHVTMPEDAKITVQCGGKLIIDGGLLTSACQGPWQGIEIEGNPNHEQIPTSYQGMIVIMNEGTIENAKCAVKAIDGGIVVAVSANFINNHRAVEFLPYRYENISLFTFCTFETNKDHLEDCDPEYFVDMTEVHSIQFNGCTFKNICPLSDPELTQRGTGIYSTNSSFYLDYECKYYVRPCEEYQYNLFQWLSYGIYATDIGFDNSMKVSHTKFIDNIKGLYLCGYSNGIEVTSNEFDVFNSSVTTDSYGMYLDQCTGYHVEDNRFHNGSLVENIVGLYINNSGTEDNMIYNNSFNTLDYAIIAHNINRDDREQSGLCIKCNDFTANTNDISVTVYNPSVTPDYGIAEFQGSMAPSNTAPAGNTFTVSGSHEYDIYNEGNNIVYIHHRASSTPLKIIPDMISSNITLVENIVAYYNKNLSCPSMLNYGEGSKENLKSLMAEASANILATQAELAEVVDGGNTEEMNTDVIMSIPDEALEIRQQLLDESPYLSDTVMKSAIYKEEVLPNAMVRDVLVANPQSAKSDDVLEALDNRWDPMPDYMMAEIMEGKDSLGAKEVLDSRLTFHKQERSNAFHTLIRNYKNDTINSWCTDSLISLLQNEEAIQEKYRLAFLYLQLHDSLQAEATLDNIPDSYELTDEQLAIHGYYIELFDLLRELQPDSLSILKLDSIQISILQTLASNDACLPGVFARNILLANKLIEYQEPVVLPNPLKSAEVRKDYSKINVNPVTGASRLLIYPNPSNQYIIVEFHLDNDGTESYIDILDASSIKVGEMQLHGSQNQVVVPVNNLKPGLYLVRLMVDQRVIESRKVAVL
jgi:hypothetical protein